MAARLSYGIQEAKRPIKNGFAAAQNLSFAACEPFFIGYAKLRQREMMQSQLSRHLMPDADTEIVVMNFRMCYEPVKKSGGSYLDQGVFASRKNREKPSCTSGDHPDPALARRVPLGSPADPGGHGKIPDGRGL
jgi:hypothetical protein